MGTTVGSAAVEQGKPGVQRGSSGTADNTAALPPKIGEYSKGHGSYFGPTEITDIPEVTVVGHGNTSPARVEPGNGCDASLPIDREFLARVIDAVSLVDAITNATAWEPGKGLFYCWNEKLKALNVAYPVYLQLLAGGDSVISVVLRTDYFISARKRHPSRRKLANIALLLVAKPRSDRDSKLCSAYTSPLIFAAANAVEPDDFVPTLQDMTLEECKEYVQAFKIRSSASVIEANADAKPCRPTLPAANHTDGDAAMTEADDVGMTLPMGRQFTATAIVPKGQLPLSNGDSCTFSFSSTSSGEVVMTVVSVTPSPLPQKPERITGTLSLSRPAQKS